MKNTARMYSGANREDVAPPTYEGTDARRPGSVKKQKQMQKAKDSLLAKQTELSTLVGKLEDRDTQQQAFTSLLELLPPLEGALVTDLYVRIEKNKNPGRSSTRRMFVLMLAAMARYHPLSTARLLPRMLSYLSLRLRDKEVQITDACAILCSAIALYVAPFACVNGKGNLSPRKKRTNERADPDVGLTAVPCSYSDDTNLQTFEHLVSHLSRETNAVGEHATRCIASILRPLEFDGSTTPPASVMGPHGKRVTGFLHLLVQSLVSKMNESTQYAGFSPTFLLLQAVLELAKLLKLQCDNRDVYDIALPHLGSLVDAIEDVFRAGPREDWVVRKRGIEVLVQLIDLFVCGETAEDNAGRLYFDHNLERIQRLVTEARHDPVSAVRDAALPAVFLYDRLAKLFPRQGQVAAPPSPFKRVCSARGGGGGARMKGFVPGSTSHGGSRHRNASDEKTVDATPSPEKETEAEMDFDDSHGDESASPQEALVSEDTTSGGVSIDPPLQWTPTASISSDPIPAAKNRALPAQKADGVKEKAARQRLKIPRIVAPKSPLAQRASVPFQPLREGEDAFPEDQGDEHIAEHDESEGEVTDKDDPTKAPATVANNDDARHVQATEEEPTMTRADAAVIAAMEGEIDLALRLTFLEDDMSLLRRVLTIACEPCIRSLSRASRTALCAAFLEFLDPNDDEEGDDVWLALAWLKDMGCLPQFVQQLDPRVLRALELKLNHLGEIPSRAGLVAADILTLMGL